MIKSRSIAADAVTGMVYDAFGETSICFNMVDGNLFTVYVWNRGIYDLDWFVEDMSDEMKSDTVNMLNEHLGLSLRDRLVITALAMENAKDVIVQFPKKGIEPKG